jgi:hypothetical protein
MKAHGNTNAAAGLGLFVTALLLALLTASCGSKVSSSDVLVKVGSRELTRRELASLAGTALDSLTAVQRSMMITRWVERALVEQEGKRRHLDRDPDIQTKLSSLRAEVYLSKLLNERAAPGPADTAVERYYKIHRSEFLRPVDAFLLELYWGEHQNVVAKFRDQLLRGDTSMVTAGDVSNEGRWLAESGELEPDLERELVSLKPGEITFPRPYEDGYRIARLIELYPAGTTLDLSVVRDEISRRLLIEQSRSWQDSLMNALRERFPVKIFIRDSI